MKIGTLKSQNNKIILLKSFQTVIALIPKYSKLFQTTIDCPEDCPYFQRR